MTKSFVKTAKTLRKRSTDAECLSHPMPLTIWPIKGEIEAEASF